VSEKLAQAGSEAAGIAGDRLSNEDLYLFNKLFRKGLNSERVALAELPMGGADAVSRVGLGQESDLQELGAGDAILVVATDLHNAAPVWWLRVKQAAERGAQLVVLNARRTRLDTYAGLAVHYPAGEALAATGRLLYAAKIESSNGDELSTAADALIGAANLVAFYGNEGLTLAESDVLAQILANLLLLKNRDGVAHAGRRNNGLVPVWPRANTQGAWDVGVADGDPAAIYEGVEAGDVRALYVMGADPVGDGLLSNRAGLGFLVVQELFLTATAELADVVLPAQSWAEREGTYTSGERRVQRFYPAVQTVGESRADWQILAQLANGLGLGKAPYAAGLVFKEMAENVPAFAGMSYRSLARWEKQWPDVGRDDLYYGGTSYDNKSGLGQQWPAASESASVAAYQLPDLAPARRSGLQVMRIPALYESGTLVDRSPVIASRVVAPTLHLHEDDAAALALEDGAPVAVSVGEQWVEVTARISGAAPAGLALLQGAGRLAGTVPADIRKAAVAAAD
jgi:NADH-quinone oxidoreductase subunit G